VTEVQLGKPEPESHRQRFRLGVDSTPAGASYLPEPTRLVVH
jgi:hypothetical protein